ncbi:MAG: PDZ domain-containing protein [Acidobacteria bacterium]|nr:PDZ domain-containing protein [Acidobacteriota bacterium]
MNIRPFALILSFLIPAGCYGQLTPSQKVSDFQQIAGAYNKRYAFLDWKKSAFGFDALNLAPWLDRASNTDSDLAFFEVVSEYVAQLRDTHSGFYLDSSFYAELGFTVDLYDGKPLVESIDKEILDPGALAFAVGDELVSIDGRPAGEMIDELKRFLGDGNATSARRLGAFFLTLRIQAYYPRAAEIGESAKLVFKTKSGATVNADVPWQKFGLPYMSGASLPDPSGSAVWKAGTRPGLAAPQSRILTALRTFKAQNREFKGKRFFTGTTDLTPLFKLPDDFVVHSGNRRFDTVYSGIFRSGVYRIGFLRIPSFEDLSFRGMLAQEVLDELTYLADTDGLIIDLMRNPGGYGCDAEVLASAFFTEPFTSLTAKSRVSWTDLRSISDELELAAYFGAEEDELQELRELLAAYTEAYQSADNFTAARPICTASSTVEPLKNRQGRPIGYKNPVMVLTDELTASAAEFMAAILQDNGRAVFYGTRTNGAGGSITPVYGGVYSDMYGSVTASQLIRSKAATVQGLPASSYIENAGIQPNIVDDYMKAENLNGGGKPFLDRVLKAMADYIKSKQPAPTSLQD